MLQRIVKSAAANGTVKTFLVLLTSKITQADMADQKRAQKNPRGYWNPNALGLMLERAQQVAARMKPIQDRDDPEAIQKLRADILRSFNEISPIRATVKQIDAYLKDGTLPSLTRR